MTRKSSRGATHYDVVLTRGAEQDLEAIYDHIAQFDSVADADHVLDRLLKVGEGLAQFPARGSHPGGLTVLGIRTFRQVMFKPYRAICRVVGSQVVIQLIVDGRRNMQSLLARRLLGG